MLASSDAPPLLAFGSFYGAARRRRPELAFAWVELVERGPSAVPAHAHASAHLCVLVRGAYRAEAARGVLARPAVLFHPAGTSHADRFLSPGRCLTLSFEDAWLAAHVEGALPSRSTLGAEPELVADGLRLLARGGAEADTSADELELAVLELLMGFVAPRPRGPCTPPWLARAQGFLRAHFARPLRVAEVAAEVGVHPVVLARGFRRCEGCSPLEFLRRVRAGEAARRLLASRASLAEIALACGHADQAQFTKSFRRVLGVTPGAFRRRG